MKKLIANYYIAQIRKTLKKKKEKEAFKYYYVSIKNL